VAVLFGEVAMKTIYKENAKDTYKSLKNIENPTKEQFMLCGAALAILAHDRPESTVEMAETISESVPGGADYSQIAIEKLRVSKVFWSSFEKNQDNRCRQVALDALKLASQIEALATENGVDMGSVKAKRIQLERVVR